MVYRILYLDHAAEMGGAEYSLLELLRALKATGTVEPFVATEANGSFAQRLRAEDIEVLPLEIPKAARHFAREKASDPLALLSQGLHWYKPLGQMKEWIHQYAIDLIHSNTLKMHVQGSLLSRLTGKPLVWHMRDIPSHRGNASRILKGIRLIQKPDAIIAISSAVRESIIGLRACRDIQVIHDGFDFSAHAAEPAVTKAEMRQRLGLPLEGTLLVCVGYFIPWKGQDTLIKAFSELYPQHPDWHLAFIGKPIFQHQEEQQRLEALGRSLGVESNVHFLGEQQDVVEKLHAFDVFVCPSTREPMGRVVLEAMAACVPIVATNAGGIPDLVTHQQEALLVPPGNPQALAGAIEALVQNPGQTQQLVRAAAIRVREKISLEQAAQAVLKLYQQLLPRG